MKHYLLAGAIGTLAGITVATQFAGPLVAQESGKNASVYEQLDLFGNVFERVRADYVEQVDDKKLIEAAINGMLTSLDPHSGYMAPKDFSDMRVQTRGEFGMAESKLDVGHGHSRIVGTSLGARSKSSWEGAGPIAIAGSGVDGKVQPDYQVKGTALARSRR